MAATHSISDMQMILLFHDGVDARGRAKLVKKVYRNVAATATHTAVYEAAQALADLQTLPLAGVQQVTTADVMGE
ncbi:DUF1659 domain-containing protein [Aneurinibacillus sp. BA2021]|nr:DUF1659 domain-containing protein [Aneurinibacillus sp. BA2021]